jgi:hypothetical protein
MDQNIENQRGDEVKSDSNGVFKSIYFENTKDMLEGLNKVSPSFCLAKWFNVSVHIPSGRTHSCYHPPSHEIPIHEIKLDSSALHNTRYKKQQRKLMLEGERPKECSFCWDIEDVGNISDRAFRSFDVNTPGIIDEALRYGSEGNPPPKYLEVNFNQSCNLKCSYCSPILSTEWHKEIKKYGPYELFGTKHNDYGYTSKLELDNSDSNPYLKAFWDWFPSIYSNLKTFRMTGGEPLMDRNTFKIFDFVKDNPHPALQLSITSNCCPPGGQWEKFISSLKGITDIDAIDHFMLFCSLDSWGKQAEYIRYGLDFNIMYKNLIQFLTQSRKHSLTFIITSNILSLPGWMTYFKNILNLRKEYNTDRQLIWFDTPMLVDPKWMSMKLASKKMLEPLLESISFMEENKETTTNRFKGFKDYEIVKVKRLYDWAIAPMDKKDEFLAKKNFNLYFQQYDERRGTNLEETFPELRQFIAECESI